MAAFSLRTLGLIVHPSRDVTEPLGVIRTWCERREVAVGQVGVPQVSRRVAPEVAASDCDLLLAIGGDGTMLAATRIAMSARRPALGIASGSLGVLARVRPDRIDAALDAVAAERFTVEDIPGLVVRRPGAEEAIALNDLSIVRAGIGQIRVVVRIDGELYARIAGDGMVVATELGSSAYTLAAGGPLLTAGVNGLVLSPLPSHGGSVAPVVVGPGARISLDVDGGYGGARLELDGQAMGAAAGRLELTRLPVVAGLLALPDGPSTVAVLRDRGILADSPRIVADDRRSDEDARVRLS